MNRSFYIKTYGCQMNDYDSEKMNDILLNNGFIKTNKVENSDVAILNTCHIREKASEKMYSDLGRLSVFKENRIRAGSNMQIIVAGCVAQAEADEILKRSKSVDFVLGPQNFHVLPKILKKNNLEKKFTNFLSDEKFNSFPISNTKGVSRLITIQEGCDKFCSFCVVPYTRGAEYSRPPEDIFAESQNLVNAGASEITLLGQNVSSYRSKIYENSLEKEINLSGLCKILSKIKGLKRIRYITSHPNDIKSDLINEHKNNKKLMPFLHLPIQSGSNRILKEMNRKHSKEDYIELIKLIRSDVPNMAFSSDFIVAYPGETNHDFEETIDLIEKINFASSYSFKYSPRPGTKSSLKKEQVDDKTSTNRLKKIQELLLTQQTNFNNSFINKTVEVLVSSRAKKNNQFVGRTKYLQPVHFFSSKNVIGETLKIKIDNLTSFSLHGKVLN